MAQQTINKNAVKLYRAMKQSNPLTFEGCAVALMALEGVTQSEAYDMLEKAYEFTK